MSLEVNKRGGDKNVHNESGVEWTHQKSRQ